MGISQPTPPTPPNCVDQHAKTTALIDLRRDQYRQRTGRELTDDNVWIRERLREMTSLDAILERLAARGGRPHRGDRRRRHREKAADSGHPNTRGA